jgi:hypothetical protein
MRADTQAVTLDAPATTVFEFLADPENLPKWAVGFAHAIRRDRGSDGDAGGDAWRVRAAQGEVGLRLTTHGRLGTIDFHMTPAPGVDVVAYSRVIPSPEGAVYVFTQLQPPGMPDAVFDGQVRALREELAVLQRIMRARHACPA